MPVVIRLHRRGTKKRPFYRVVAADSRKPRDGRFLEIIGTYNPFSPDTDQIRINENKAISWIKKGAQLSDTVKGLFSKVELFKKIAESET